MNIKCCTVHAIGLQDFETVSARLLCIRPSTLGKDAGMGLFARRSIKGKRILGEYKGVSVDAHNPAYDSAYVFATSRGLIDGRTVYSQVKFINHQAGFKANVVARELHVDGRIYIISKRHISADEELFLDYGDGYDWETPPTTTIGRPVQSKRRTITCNMSGRDRIKRVAA